MKKLLSILLFYLAMPPQLFSQPPTMQKSDGRDKYSNNQILTMNDMVFNNPIQPIKNVKLDTNSILIYDLDGTLLSYNLKSNKINWKAKASGPDREMCGNKLALKVGHEALKKRLFTLYKQKMEI